MYDIEESSGEMPSLTLIPGGYDKSTIRRNFPGWFFFSMTPNLLMCTGYWISSGAKGPNFPKFAVNELLNYGRAGLH